MKKLNILILLAWLAVFGFAQQNTLTTTTLSAAIGTTTPAVPGTTAVCFPVTSVTGINGPSISGNPGQGGTQSTIGSFLLIDREMVQVQSVSSTAKTVCGWRGVNGTRASSHQTNALVWIGNADWYSGVAIGTAASGSCSATVLYAYPDVHVLDGTWWACRSDGLWGFAGPGIGAIGAIPNRTTVADAAYTANPWDYQIAYTSLTATRAVTLPAANSMPGKVYEIVDESGSAGTDNITVANASSHCSSVSANYGVTRCVSNGTNWYNW